LGLGLLIAVAGAVALIVFMPRGWVWDRMILQSAAGNGADAIAPHAPTDDLVGRVGVATSALRPAGQVEIDGKRHEARVAYGSLERGASVRVTGRQGSELIVQPEETA
ncbi:MAG: NfeD family protein, partial [Verrucomicrobiota bacterium]